MKCEEVWCDMTAEFFKEYLGPNAQKAPAAGPPTGRARRRKKALGSAGEGAQTQATQARSSGATRSAIGTTARQRRLLYALNPNKVLGNVRHMRGELYSTAYQLYL